MTGEAVALALLKLALATAPKIVELVTGQKAADLEARIERARVAIKDPIDTTVEDAARDAELERIIRGES